MLTLIADHETPAPPPPPNRPSRLARARTALLRDLCLPARPRQQDGLDGKVVLVTGGSSGIGLATAQRLAAAGAVTLICGRDAEKLEQARRQIALSGQVIAYLVDIADLDQVDAFVARLVREHGGVDVLINNAGRSIRRAIEDSLERFHDFERTMQINYFGALRLTMGLLPHMARRRAGHVINISSIGVLTQAPRFSAYVASKAALEAWTACAATEYADAGVRFTTINMPLVKTPMIAPTRVFDHVPTLTTEEAADMVMHGVRAQPARIATKVGVWTQALRVAVPGVARLFTSTLFLMFPD
jgi:NAD(P)-dependent dehydrogenase (short-subunit alcohol dehydrogenase family)